MLSTPPYVVSPGSCGWRAWDTGTMPPLPSHLAAPHFYAVQSILGSLMPCILPSSLSLRDEREEKSWCRDE